MVNPLGTIDSVGLGRPICRELCLCNDILEGKRIGAVHHALDMNDFGITKLIAGAQVRQVGNDNAIIDLTKPKILVAFKKDTARWL